jgi:hypothetical protein
MATWYGYNTKIFDKVVSMHATAALTIDMSSGADTDFTYGVELILETDSAGDIVRSAFYTWNTNWISWDLTYATGCTKANFNANTSTFPFTVPYNKLRIIAVQTTPSTAVIKNIDFQYTKYSVLERKAVLAYCYVRDSDNGRTSGITVTAQLCDIAQGSDVKWGSDSINLITQSKTTDDDGYVWFELAPNDDPLMLPANSHWQITVGNNPAKKYTIPCANPTVDINSLTAV